MTPLLTPEGYAQTKMKLANMEARLAALQTRNDINPIHKEEARRSYIDMIRQYSREIKLYEIAQARAAEPPVDGKPTPPEAAAEKRLG